ncbi:MAG: hypothetical protein WAN36_01025, partial [Calditrichia bacterium]
MTVNPVRNLVKQNVVVISALVITGFVLVLFLMLPLGRSRINKQEVTRIHFADNISSAHNKLIARFNEEYRGRIQVVPIDLPFSKFSTNERKELLARSLRSKSD